MKQMQIRVGQWVAPDQRKLRVQMKVRPDSKCRFRRSRLLLRRSSDSRRWSFVATR